MFQSRLGQRGRRARQRLADHQRIRAQLAIPTTDFVVAACGGLKGAALHSEKKKAALVWEAAKSVAG